MNWIYWLHTMCPKDWTNEDVLRFVSIDCPEVTLEDIEKNR